MKISAAIGKPLPEQFLSAIGDYVVSWSWLEFTAQEALWGLLGTTRKIGRSVTGQMEMRGFMRALRALARQRANNQSLLEQIEALAEKIENACNERNGIVHGTWEYDEARGTATVREHRYSAPTGRTSIWSPARVKAAARRFRSWRTKLTKLMLELASSRALK